MKEEKMFIFVKTMRYCAQFNVEFVYVCRVGENGDWDATKGINTPNNYTLYQVTELRPFTVYSFRVVAVNAMGRSRSSKESYYMVTLRNFISFLLHFLPF
jgi:hypothetical protein